MAEEASRNRKVAPDLPSGRLIGTLRRPLLTPVAAAVVVEEAQAVDEAPQQVAQPEQQQAVRLHQPERWQPVELRQRAVRRQVADEAAVVVAVTPRLRNNLRSRVSRTIQPTASMPVSRISADWPREFGTFPIS